MIDKAVHFSFKRLFVGCPILVFMDIYHVFSENSNRVIHNYYNEMISSCIDNNVERASS